MNVTNRHGAPSQFVRALENDAYTKGDADFSATGLLKPPQATHLERLHEHELSTDVADMVFALLGTGVHAALEKFAPKGALVERRFYGELGGYKVSGAIDLYDDGHVMDYKVTGTYSTKVGKPEWEQQLNIYAWLLRQNDMPVKSLTIWAICRDWSAMKVEREKRYPVSPIVTVEIPVWLPKAAQDFVQERIELHTSEPVPPCTDSERWARRDGRYVRCEKYCSVADFCPQFNEGKIL